MKHNTGISPEEPQLVLEEFLPYRLSRAYEIVSRRFARVYRDRYGLTRPEWRVFATIGQFGAITATQIGAHSAMHKTKVSRAVAALEKRSWLSRETDLDDRRVEHITLTKTGRTAYRDMVKVAKEFEDRMTTAMGAKASDMLSKGIAAIERTDKES